MLLWNEICSIWSPFRHTGRVEPRKRVYRARSTQGTRSLKSERNLMTISQFGGNFPNALGCSWLSILQDQRSPPPNGVVHLLIIDDISQIVEVNAKIFKTRASNRKPNLNIFFWTDLIQDEIGVKALHLLHDSLGVLPIDLSHGFDKVTGVLDVHLILPIHHPID